MIAALSTRPALAIEGLTVGYDHGRLLAVEDLSLGITQSEFVSIIGPTGCGKSTILNAIAGFKKPLAGTIHLDGEPLDKPGPDRGYIFQDFDATLFMWTTVRGNVEFGPKVRGVDATERRESVSEVLKQVGLDSRAESYCFELSGGMRQRVAIARCLVNRPRVLLMDEPFGSLDAQTRSIMQRLLLSLWQEYRPTIIFVTHDIDEAIILSDRIIVLGARPAQIKAEIVVDLPRPREEGIVVSEDFIRLKREMLAIIRGAVEAQE